MYENTDMMRRVNVFWAQRDFLGFHFPAFKRLSPCNISGRSQPGAPWPPATGLQFPRFAVEKTLAWAKAAVQASLCVFLGGFEFFGPRRGSVLRFKELRFHGDQLAEGEWGERVLMQNVNCDLDKNCVLKQRCAIYPLKTAA